MNQSLAKELLLNFRGALVTKVGIWQIWLAPVRRCGLGRSLGLLGLTGISVWRNKTCGALNCTSRNKSLSFTINFPTIQSLVIKINRTSLVQETHDARAPLILLRLPIYQLISFVLVINVYICCCFFVVIATISIFTFPQLGANWKTLVYLAPRHL